METIEPATLEDIPQLAELLNVLFREEGEFQPDRKKQARALGMIIDSADRGIIFVARDGSEVAGMVGLLPTISTAEGGLAYWLEDLVVRPDRRGDGIGTRLLQHAIDYARAQGSSRITLLTGKKNTRAIQLYRRHGFTETTMTSLRLGLDAGSGTA